LLLFYLLASHVSNQRKAQSNLTVSLRGFVRSHYASRDVLRAAGHKPRYKTPF